MSLRYQINMRIMISSLCILLLGGSIAIWQARYAVEKEVDSSINLVVQVITFGFSQASQTSFNETDWLPKLNSINQTRHLSIQLKTPSGEIIRVAHKNKQTNQQESHHNGLSLWSKASILKLNTRSQPLDAKS